MFYKLSKKFGIAIFFILTNNFILSSGGGDKITLGMLSLLLIPNDSLKEKIIKQYEPLLKQIFPDGLISLELGSKFKSQPDHFDYNYSPRTFSEDSKTYIKKYPWEKISIVDTNTNNVIEEFDLQQILNKKHFDIVVREKNYIAIAGANIIILINANKEIKILNDNQTKSDRISQLSFSPDCKRLAYGNYEDNNIIIWDIANEKDIKYQNLKNEHSNSVTCSFGKDEKYFVSNCGLKICIWNAKDLSVIAQINNGDFIANGRFNYVKLSNDNKYIIVGISKPYSQGGRAEIWDIENPSAPIKRIETPNLGDGFINVAISNDGKYFITTNWNQIILWKINDLISGSRNPIYILQESNRDDPKAIYNLEFNRNDKYLICSGHGSPKIFDFSKNWMVDNLNLQQIILIIILASSNDLENEGKLNPHYKTIADSLYHKADSYLSYFLILKKILNLNGIIGIINSYSSYDFL